MPEVTAVITTFERPDDCERALRSVLGQAPPPSEVLICDDGSRDDTPERFRAWEARDARVRYLRAGSNTGSPGTTRNLGVTQARGDWVAFLDDDDSWRPGKLAAQLDHAGDADVIGTNARRNGGADYFPDAPVVARPRYREFLRDNPLIVSSVMARRSAVMQAGGFLTSRWARGVADYDMWLALVRREARCVVLGRAFVEYEDLAADRMSAAPVAQELAVARMFWRRYARSPLDGAALRASLGKTIDALRLAGASRGA